MSQLYNNKELLNNGFHLNGKAPIDDRTLFDMLSDLYVDGTHPERHPLFNRAYKGMQVAVFTDSADGRYEALNLTLLDAAPYIPENNITLNADNFDQYWSIAGNVVQRYVDNVVDPSINRLWDYTRTTNIFNKDNTGAITVETDNYAQVGEHIVGSVYNLKINTDDDTIKIVGDALAGGKYKLTKMAGDAVPSGMFSAYKLSYM